MLASTSISRRHWTMRKQAGPHWICRTAGAPVIGQGGVLIGTIADCETVEMCDQTVAQ